jgi:lipoprotein-releasing system permease protein
VRIRLPFEWMVALRFLREGRMQSLLILAGVTFGVAVVVFLTQLITQLQASLIDRVLGMQAHVVLRPLELWNRQSVEGASAAIVQPRVQRLRSLDQWESLVRLLETTPGVVAVSPMATGPGFAIRGEANNSIALVGIEPERYRRIARIDSHMQRGHFDIRETNAVIGTELARELGVGVGDRMRVRSALGRDEVLTVAGVFDVENRELNRRWVFTTLRLAQSLLDLPGGVSNIDLAVTEIFEAEQLSALLRAQTGVTVESWMQTNAGLLAALRNQRISNRMIRSFVTVIVALGIASVLVVSVVQKQKEIGILRAMGASRARILAIFLLQGGLVGFFGSVSGVALSWTLLNIFSHIFRDAEGAVLFAPQLPTELVISACVAAVLVGVVSAVIPAQRAARMDPVQAIRG